MSQRATPPSRGAARVSFARLAGTRKQTACQRCCNGLVARRNAATWACTRPPATAARLRSTAGAAPRHCTPQHRRSQVQSVTVDVDATCHMSTQPAPARAAAPTPDWTCRWAAANLAAVRSAVHGTAEQPAVDARVRNPSQNLHPSQTAPCPPRHARHVGVAWGRSDTIRLLAAAAASVRRRKLGVAPGCPLLPRMPRAVRPHTADTPTETDALPAATRPNDMH